MDLIKRSFFGGAFGKQALVLALALAWPALSAAQDKNKEAPAETSSTPPIPSGETISPPRVAQPGTAPGRSAKPAKSAPASGTPIQWGSFLVYPEINATYLFDDNIFYTNSQKFADEAWVFSPAVWVQSNWAQHALNFNAGADSTRYQTYSTEDTDDYRVNLEGRYDFAADTNVYGGAHYSQNHEDRESPDARNGLLPTIYWQNRYYGGFFHQADRFSVRIAGTANKLNYRDVPFLTGSGQILMINNDDRDRWQYTGGVRFGYEASPRLEPYLQLAFDNRKYQETPDDLGYQKSSDGQRYLVGLKWNVPRSVKLDAFVGVLKQNYDDPRYSDVDKPLYGGALVWAITPQTRFSASLDRTLEETNLTQTIAPGVVESASSYLNTFASAGLNHRLTSEWSLRGILTASDVDYEGIDRDDKYYGAIAGVGYRPHPNVFLDLSVSFRKLNSSIPTEDFRKRVIYMRMAIPFSN